MIFLKIWLQIKNKLLEHFLFLGVGIGVGLILFIPRTVLKQNIQFLLREICAIFYLLKDTVAKPHPLKWIFSKYYK